MGHARIVLTHSSPINSGDTHKEVTTFYGVSHVRYSDCYTVLHCWIDIFCYNKISWWQNPKCHSCIIEKEHHNQSCNLGGSCLPQQTRTVVVLLCNMLNLQHHTLMSGNFVRIMLNPPPPPPTHTHTHNYTHTHTHNYTCTPHIVWTDHSLSSS